MRKPITILLTCIYIFAFVLLQINFFNAIPLYDTTANIGIILVAGIGLLCGKIPGASIGVAYGLLIDIILSKTLGVYTGLFIAIGIISGHLSKNFSKSNKMSIIMMISLMTVLFEIGAYLCSVILYGYEIEIVGPLIIILKETIYNVIVSIIGFEIIKKLGELINKIKSSYYLL